MEEKILNYIDQHGITFELRAVTKDNEVIAKFTSPISADDVSGYASLLDSKIDEQVIDELSAEQERDDE